MKICGKAMRWVASYPVELLQEHGNMPISRDELTYADLWRSDVIHEGCPGEGDGAYYSVTLRGGVPPEDEALDIDVLDGGSATRAAALFTDVDTAEKHLLSALTADTPSAALQRLDQVEAVARRWAHLGGPQPCTIDVDAATAARVHAGKEHCVLRQESADAQTVFWTLYDREPDGTSRARIDVIDWEGAQLVDAARDQLVNLATVAALAREDIACGREHTLQCEEMDLAPVGWPSFKDMGVPAWLKGLAERGLDLDPGDPNLAEKLCALRDDDGTPRMGRRNAHRLAWEMRYIGNAGVFSIDDLRAIAAADMPAAAAARGEAAAPSRPAVQTFVVETTGAGDELEVCGASIPEEQLDQLLRSAPGVVLAKDQNDTVIEMMLDMDQESLIARPVELLENGTVRYLDDCVAPSP